jgi:hypothetical protein
MQMINLQESVGEVTVAAINVKDKLVMLDDGEIVPICVWLFWRDEVNSYEEANFCVAGPTNDGCYIPIDLRSREPVYRN